MTPPHPTRALVRQASGALHTVMAQASASTDDLNGLGRGIIVAVSVSASILLLLVLSLLVFWLCFRRSERDSDSLYYKFDVETNATSAGDAQRDDAQRRPQRRVDVQSANRKWGYADEADIVDVDVHCRHKLGQLNASYTSVDDAVYAPRMQADEVQSSGVGYLDDYGRPIASPYR